MRPRIFQLFILFTILLVPAVCAEDALEWYTMGQNAATAGDYQKAITCYNNALSADPNYAPALAGKAAALNVQEKYSDALIAADKALGIRKADAVALNARAFALLGLGNYSQSAAAYDDLFKIQTNLADAYCNQGYAYLQLNESEAAVIAYDRCTLLDPLNIVSWDRKGQAYMNLGDFESALRMYNAGTRLTVNNATLWNHKGLAYVALGMPQDALQCFEKALGIDQTFADAKKNRENMMGKQQNFNISGTLTPVPTISRIGTFYTTVTPAPPTTILVTPSDTHVPAETVEPAISSPAPKRTTYSPLSPLPAIGALVVVCGLVFVMKKN